MQKNLTLVGVAALMLALGGCATQNTVNPEAQRTQGWPVERLYNEAHKELNTGNYKTANNLYALLESRYPGTPYVEQSMLDTAYGYYKDEEREKALAAIERFQQHYPASPSMDYALYLKGLVLFNEDKSVLNKLAAQDWSDRDPKANREAYAAFYELVSRYPNSRYTADATERMVKIINGLGGHEIAIARYYMKRGAWLAAAARAKNVVQGFQNTPYVEESLAIMMSAYSHLGQTQLAEDTKRVLAQNYPNSRYLTQAWKPNDAPWWRYWK